MELEVWMNRVSWAGAELRRFASPYSRRARLCVEVGYSKYSEVGYGEYVWGACVSRSAEVHRVARGIVSGDVRMRAECETERVVVEEFVMSRL